jgi:hypothetical protein
VQRKTTPSLGPLEEGDNEKGEPIGPPLVVVGYATERLI